MAKQHIEDHLLIENHHLIEKKKNAILNFFFNLDIIVDKSIQTIVHKLFQKNVPLIVE